MSDTPTRSVSPAGDDAPTGDPGVTTAPGGSSDGMIPPPPAHADRYELHAEIARGGMGEIYNATDTVLGREVAVKVLQFRFALNAAVERRFADEARIAAQLQHPNIPAVHDLGTLPDGRPFLAMKLIKGDTLEDLLKARPDPAADRGRFLAVFEKVCEAVGYAHNRKVIHRDLKPSNVMVGKYGEVQVMDWGLAKVLGTPAGLDTEGADPSELPETTIRTPRESFKTDTLAGSVMGTPAYMPPEQAIGAVDQIDERSDVFGLGAILCAVLTGKPPYLGADSESSRQLAALAKLDDAFARLDNCRAEPELVALCRRCLNPEKAGRPAGAGKVAEAVAALRAEAEERSRRAELDWVRAEGERAKAEAEAREQKKRRRAQLALAGAVALFLFGGLVVAWWQDRQGTKRQTEAEARARDENERLDRNATALAGSLVRCESALVAGAADPAADALAEVERRIPEGGGDALAGRIERCRVDLALLRDLDAVDQFRWTPVGGRLPDLKDVTARRRAVFAKFGLIPATSADETARRITASLVKDRLLLALDLCLIAEPDSHVWAILKAADPDAYRDDLRDAAMAPNAARVGDLAGRAEALAQPLRFAAALGQNGVVTATRRREVLLVALRARPGDLTLLMALGDSYPINQRAGADERVRWFQAAVASHPRSAAAHISLGNALFDRDDLDGAVASFREAVRLDSTSAAARGNLGVALRRRGNLDEAVAECGEAVRLDIGNPQYHFLLGIAQRDRGDLAEAVASLTEADRLAPTQPVYRAAVQQVERWRELVSRLATVAAGPIEPKRPLEALDFVNLAQVCRQPFQRKYVLATRLYAGAFAGKFASAKFLAETNQYDAACCAVLAASGRDAELPSVGVEEWGHLTDLAYRWLLAEYARLNMESKNPKKWPELAVTLAEWKRTPDLAAIRDPAWLAAMPAPDRKRWAEFWATADAGLAWVSRPVPE